MQTTTLPILSSGAAPAPQRPNPSANLDAGQFGAALSREIEQRQEMAPPSAPAPQPKAPAREQSAQADGAAPPESQSGAQEAARPEQAKADQAKPAAKPAKAGDHHDDADKDDATSAGHPDTAHVTDMLALVASLKPLQNAAAARAAGAQADAAPVAGTGKAGAQAAQLAALQAAVKALDKDGAAQPGGKALAVQADAAAGAGAVAPGVAAAADGSAGAKGGFDMRAVQEAAAGQLKVHADAAPARDALADLAALKEPAPAAPLLAQAAPVALDVAQAAAAAGERIAARVGTPAWDNQVGQKIVWMAAGDEQSASLTLNPPDLGPLQVVLSVTNDQASVTFSSNQLEVRQALENALPRLREMMGDSGIALGNATVNAGMPDQRQAQGGDQGRSGAAPSGRFDAGVASAEPAARPVIRTTTLRERGVDTFA